MATKQIITGQPDARAQRPAGEGVTYQEAASWACKLAAHHGRRAVVALLARFGKVRLYHVPNDQLPEFVKVCKQALKITASGARKQPVEM